MDAKGLCLLVVVAALAALGCRGPSGSISRDGSLVAWSSPDGLVIQRTDRSKPASIVFPKRVEGIAWSPNGRWIAFGRPLPVGPGMKEEFKAVLYDIRNHRTKELPLLLHPPLVWSGDSATLFAVKWVPKSRFQVIAYAPGSASSTVRSTLTSEPSRLSWLEPSGRLVMETGADVSVWQGPHFRMSDVEAIADGPRPSSLLVAHLARRDMRILAMNLIISMSDAHGNLKTVLGPRDCVRLLSEDRRVAFPTGMAFARNKKSVLIAGEEDASPSGVMDAYVELALIDHPNPDQTAMMRALEEKIELRQVVVQLDVGTGRKRCLWRGHARQALDFETEVSWSQDGTRAFVAGVSEMQIVDIPPSWPSP